MARLRDVALVVIGSTLLAAPAIADETVEAVHAVRLRYDVPAECPSRTLFEGTLHFRSARVLPVLPEAEGTYGAVVHVEPTTSGFRGSLEIGPGASGPRTRREIEGTQCQSVVEALGFTIALLLDPEGVNSAALPSDVELERIAESARAKATPPPPPPPSSSPTERPVAPPPVPVAKTAARLLAELGGGASSAVHGIAPRAHAGIEARLWLASLESIEPFAKIGGFLQPEGEASAPIGTVSYVPTGGRLDVGVLRRSGASSFRLGAGAHFTTMVMPVDAPSATERLPSLRLIPSAGPALRVTWEPSIVGFAFETSAGAHFVRERFQIEADGVRGQVFRLPAVYVQATIGVVVRFVDPTRASGT